MDRLAIFLVSDVGCYSSSFKKWAESLDESSYGGNFSVLYKEEGSVLIGEEMSEEPDGGPFFKISIEDFVKVLDQWEEFCKTRPKEILITRENGVIRIEGKN